MLTASSARAQNGRKLRVGLMCRGTRFRAWEAACIAHLLARGDVEISLLIQEVGATATSVSGLLRKVSPRHLFFQLYMKAVCRPRSMRWVDLDERLREVPVLRCEVSLEGRHSQHFSTRDVRDIRGYDLDFILRFGFNIIRGPILDAARYGVWSFHHDDEEKYRGGPPCFWEIARGDPVTGAVLQRLTERLDAGVILWKGHFKTIDYSYRRNLDQVYFASSRWPAQMCEAIQSGERIPEEPSRTDAPIYRRPGNLEMVRFWARMGTNLVCRVARTIFVYDTWEIGVVERPIHTFLEKGPREVRWLAPQDRRRFRADPFGLVLDGVRTVLAEEFDFRTGRGRIVSIDLTNPQQPGPARAALESERHFSFPFLFRDGDTIYCLPETSLDRELALFRADSFPDGWSKLPLLEDTAAVDPAIFFHDGRWWLTFTRAGSQSSADLEIWYADAVCGPWRPHRLNPVKSDIRSARPAGTPFRHHGKLYRPAQDCSRTYGGSVVINRVDVLTPSRFAEEAVAFVRPHAGWVDGTHTLSAMGEATLVDGKRRRIGLRGSRAAVGRLLREWRIEKSAAVPERRAEGSAEIEPHPHGVEA